MTETTDTHPHPVEASPCDVFAYWEEKYGSQEGVWSGHANAALSAVAAGLTPGRALDLGAGEGGDALWLAERGWTVTGVDVSPTALARAEVAAERASLRDRLTWVAADLEEWVPDDTYDLVVACFLQSPIALRRAEILRRAAQWLTVGGHLLVVAHAAAPPWSDHAHDMVFPTPADDLEALDLPEDSWEVVIAEVRDRQTYCPDGTPATLRDGVLVVRRTA